MLPTSMAITITITPITITTRRLERLGRGAGVAKAHILWSWELGAERDVCRRSN